MPSCPRPMPLNAVNSPESTMAEATLVEAINLALRRAMEDDPSVVVLGEDVGVDGGVFRATVGLQDRFGSERVLDTPLAELLISGLCVGMAAQGLKPVGEIQFMGFLYPCRSTGEPRIENAQPHPGTPRLPNGSAHAAWSRHSRARASFRKHRGDALPYSRIASYHAFVAGTRLRTSPRRDPRSRSGRVSGANTPLPRSERQSGGRWQSLAAGSCLCPAERSGRHTDQLGRGVERDYGRGRCARRRGHRCRGPRSCHPEAV